MNQTVILNDTKLHAYDYEEGIVQQENRELRTLNFKFQVTSKEYHDIAVLLYKNDFYVEVPDRSIKMQADIRQYSTSITNLYEKGQVGEYVLQLKEKVQHAAG